MTGSRSANPGAQRLKKTGEASQKPEGRNAVKQDEEAVFCVAMNGAQRQRKILPHRPFALWQPVIVRASIKAGESLHGSSIQQEQTFMGSIEHVSKQLDDSSQIGKVHISESAQKIETLPRCTDRLVTQIYGRILS
jgi:hypothetical protein